ncbi:MAG: RsmD family RNA methyltransferase [Saprospiraceae bacterium]
MRIIGGKLGGRLLKPNMKGWPTRPTTDISKEALFNILQNRIDFEGIRVLDLFGGAGNHSFEFLSRGCEHVTYVDLHPKCLEFVKKQSVEFGCEGRINVVRGDVRKFLKNCTLSFNYIFAGPPYPLIWLKEIPDIIGKRNLLNKGDFWVLEHNPTHDFSNHTHFIEKRKYGQTIFSFFAP